MKPYVTSKIIEDTLLKYPNGRGDIVACRARLFESTNGFVLIATDGGFGLTGTIDRVATIMVRRWEIETRRLRVIEHYDERKASARAPGQPDETFAFVGFDWDGMFATNPTWRATTRAEVQDLLGEARLW